MDITGTHINRRPPTLITGLVLIMLIQSASIIFHNMSRAKSLLLIASANNHAVSADGLPVKQDIFLIAHDTQNLITFVIALIFVAAIFAGIGFLRYIYAALTFLNVFYVAIVHNATIPQITITVLSVIATILLLHPATNRWFKARSK